jgi:hypothetical protein
METNSAVRNKLVRTALVVAAVTAALTACDNSGSSSGGKGGQSGMPAGHQVQTATTVQAAG